LEEDVKEEILNLYFLLRTLLLWLFGVNKDKMTNSERERLGEILNEVERKIEILKG